MKENRQCAHGAVDCHRVVIRRILGKGRHGARDGCVKVSVGSSEEPSGNEDVVDHGRALVRAMGVMGGVTSLRE